MPHTYHFDLVFRKFREEFLRTYEPIAHSKGKFPAIEERTFSQHIAEYAELYRRLVELSNEAHLACRKLRCIEYLEHLDEDYPEAWDGRDSSIEVYSRSLHSSQVEEYYAQRYQIESFFNEIREAARHSGLVRGPFWKISELIEIAYHIGDMRPNGYWENRKIYYEDLYFAFAKSCPIEDINFLIDFIRQFIRLLRRVNLRWDSICKPHPYEKDPLGPCYACPYREMPMMALMDRAFASDMDKANYHMSQIRMNLHQSRHAMAKLSPEDLENLKKEYDKYWNSLFSKEEQEEQKEHHLYFRLDPPSGRGGNSKARVLFGPDEDHLTEIKMPPISTAILLTLAISQKAESGLPWTAFDFCTEESDNKSLFRLVFHVIKNVSKDKPGNHQMIKSEKYKMSGTLYNNVNDANKYLYNPVVVESRVLQDPAAEKEDDRIELNNPEDFEINHDKYGHYSIKRADLVEIEDSMLKGLRVYAVKYGYGQDVIDMLNKIK